MNLVIKSNSGYKAIASLLIFQTLFISLPETLLFADPIPQASPESSPSSPTISLEEMIQMASPSPSPSPTVSAMPVWGVEPNALSVPSPSPSPSAAVIVAAPASYFISQPVPSPSPSASALTEMNMTAMKAAPSSTPPIADGGAMLGERPLMGIQQLDPVLPPTFQVTGSVQRLLTPATLSYQVINSAGKVMDYKEIIIPAGGSSFTFENKNYAGGLYSILLNLKRNGADIMPAQYISFQVGATPTVQLNAYVSPAITEANVQVNAIGYKPGYRIVAKRAGAADVTLSCNYFGICSGPLTNLNQDTNYTVTIVAYDTTGKEIPGKISVDFRTQQRAVGIRAAAEAGSTSAQIYVVANGLAAGDKVLIRRTGAADTVLTCNSSGSCKGTVINLNPETNYMVTAVAVDVNGKELAGKVTLNFRTQPMRGVTLRAAAEPGSTSATVYVTALGDMQNTDKLILRRAGAADIILNYNVTGYYQTTITGLNPVTDYAMTIIPIDKDGRELNGKLNLSFRTQPMRTVAMQGAVEPMSTSASVYVRAAGLQTGDRVVLRRSGAADLILTCDIAGQCTGSITGLNPLTDYTVSVVALDKDGRELTGKINLSFRTQPMRTVTLNGAAEAGSTEATIYVSAYGLETTDRLIVRRSGAADVVLSYDPMTGRYKGVLVGLNPLTDYMVSVLAVDKNGRELNGKINLNFRTQPMRTVTLRAVAEPAITSATVFVTALANMQNTDKLIIRRPGAADVILNYDITGRYQVTLNGLNALTDYNVTVLAVDKNGRELNGKINLSFRTLPTRMIGVKVSALETTTSTATVGVKLLNSLAPGDRVIVRRTGAADVVLSCNSASMCQGTISGLIPDSNYSAGIVILDKDGKPLTLSGITTFSFKTQPSLPIRVDKTIVMNDQAKITWSKDPDAVLYWVQIHDAKTGKLVHEGFPATTNETFAIYDSNGKIYPEGSYIVTVRPSYTGRVEDGKLGPAVQAPMYVDFSYFRRSQLMLSSNQVFGQNGKVTLSWAPVPDARVYWVKVYSRIDGKLVYEGFPATTSESFVLPPGAYTFEVTASLSKKVEDGVLNKKGVGLIRT